MALRHTIKLHRGRDMGLGEHKRVTITRVLWDEGSGRVDVTFGDAEGGSIHAVFDIGTADSAQTERQVKALDRLSLLCEAALGGETDELDPKALEGREVYASVWDNEVPDHRTGRPRTFRNIGYFEPADTAPEEEPHDEPDGGPGQGVPGQGVPFGYQPEDWQ